MHSDFTSDEEDVQRFIRAMSTMVGIHHPHLIALYAAGKHIELAFVSVDERGEPTYELYGELLEPVVAALHSVAIGGGLGVSLTTAAHLRTALVWLCWSTLALLIARLVARVWTLHRSRVATAPSMGRDARRSPVRTAAA